MPASASRTYLPWLFVALSSLAAVVAGLSSFRARNQALLSEQHAEFAKIETKSLSQELEIERLLTQRLSKDSVDLGRIRIAILSAADPTAAGSFAVVWSPDSGEGTLIQIAEVQLSTGPQFVLSAVRKPTDEKFETDVVFDHPAPSHFSRGLFTYQPSHPEQVTAFSLQLHGLGESAETYRFGGLLKP